MTDYRVNLDIFAGPMDLLLYLVRKEEVDIYDIPIAKITDQYVHYIEMLKTFDVNLAGDFLVMAATLMQIKSAMLLPKVDETDVEDGDITDPRTELIRQLLEYKKFKDAANQLNAVADLQFERFSRPATIVEHIKPQIEPEVDLENVSIWDLLDAFDHVCKSVGQYQDISHIVDDTSIDLYQIEMLHRLQSEGPMTFERIFEGAANRLVMVGLFLGLLELIRGKLVWAEQPVGSTIYLKALTDEPAEQAVQKAIMDVESEGRLDIEAEQPKKTPIPITELPPEKQPAETRVPENEETASTNS